MGPYLVKHKAKINILGTTILNLPVLDTGLKIENHHILGGIK